MNEDDKNKKFADQNAYKTYLKSILDDETEELTTYKKSFSEKKIEDEVSNREQIINEGLKQDIQLKKLTLLLLFIFLAAETITVFVYSFFQATHWPMSFMSEEWSFKLLVSATITQITVMLIIAVKHLFPNKK